MREGWTYKKLGEFCELYQPQTISSKELIEDGLYPVYGANGVIGRYDKYNHEHSELLMTCRGATCGTINISTPFAWINGNAMVIHPKSYDITIPFLAFQLGGIDLSDIITGAAQPQITRQTLTNKKIGVPSLQEQQQIVSELDLLSSVIEKQKAQIEELDKLAQSIFYDMFGDPVENEKGWEVKKLGEVGTIVAGGTPSTADEDNWNGEINWVTPAELGKQLFYGETERKITQKGAKNLTMMPVGTVLLSTRAPIGKLAITTVPMCCNQGFKNIICDDSLNNIFLYFYLLYTLDKIKAMGVGATFKEVSKKAISLYDVIIPPLSLQQEFADKIEAIESMKAKVCQSLKESEMLFNSRMDFYFS